MDRRKVGRNDPCPCGSGKKYKKCCMEKDREEASFERARELAELARESHLAEQAAEREVALFGGRRPAQMMMDFADPLFEPLGEEPDMEEFQDALEMARVFWNLAVCRDERERERRFDQAADELGLDDRGRERFRANALKMIARHRSMFPDMHEELAKSPGPPELPPRQRKVLREVEQCFLGIMDRTLCPQPSRREARLLWHAYFHRSHPQVKKPEVYAAAVHYTVLSPRDRKFTQARAARLYGVTAPSVSRVHSELLQVDDLDEAFYAPPPGEPESPVLEELLSLPRSREYWLLGIRDSGLTVEIPSSYSPSLLVCLDLQTESVVGFAVGDQDEGFSDLPGELARMMLDPAYGDPRRPEVVLADDDRTVEKLRALAGELDFGLEPSRPEPVDRVVDLLRSRLGLEASERSYLQDGSIPQKTVARFFEAAGSLLESAPWDFLDDSQVVEVRFEALSPQVPCVSVTGSAETSPGLIIFESRYDFESFIEHSDDLAAADPRSPWPQVPFLSLHFLDAADLNERMRKEAMSNSWQVRDAGSYPCLSRTGTRNPLQPPTERDYLTATLCALALSRAVDEHPDEIDEAWGDKLRYRVRVRLGDRDLEGEVRFHT